MSLVLPPLFHWSPSDCRANINKRGLRPTCPTANHQRPFRQDMKRGHYVITDQEASFRAVCLGTTPSHAWSLSGNISAERGSTWDLWQVILDDDDEVYPMSFFGYRLDEVRVANRIPKSQVWYVATRIVQKHGRR